MYHLAEVLLYGENPPHYYPFIRLGKVKPGGGTNVQYERLNDGDWIKFDDLQFRPERGDPFGHLPQVSFTLLIEEYQTNAMT